MTQYALSKPRVQQELQELMVFVKVSSTSLGRKQKLKEHLVLDFLRAIFVNLSECNKSYVQAKRARS